MPKGKGCGKRGDVKMDKVKTMAMKKARKSRKK